MGPKTKAAVIVVVIVLVIGAGVCVHKARRMRCRGQVGGATQPNTSLAAKGTPDPVASPAANAAAAPVGVIAQVGGNA